MVAAPARRNSVTSRSWSPIRSTLPLRLPNSRITLTGGLGKHRRLTGIVFAGGRWRGSRTRPSSRAPPPRLPLGPRRRWHRPRPGAAPARSSNQGWWLPSICTSPSWGMPRRNRSFDRPWPAQSCQVDATDPAAVRSECGWRQRKCCWPDHGSHSGLTLFPNAAAVSAVSREETLGMRWLNPIISVCDGKLVFQNAVDGSWS